MAGAGPGRCRPRRRRTGSGRRRTAARPSPRRTPATGTGTPSRPPSPRRAPPAGPRPGPRTPPARRRCRRRPANAPCRAPLLPDPTTFIASTGNTQGIRLRISPPRNASPACAAAASSAVAAAPCLQRRAPQRRSPARSGRGSTGCPESPFSGRNALPGRSAESEAALPDRQRLRGTVADGAGRIGDEPGVDHRRWGQLRRPAPTASRPAHHRVPGRRSRHLPVGCGEQRRLRRRRRRARWADRAGSRASSGTQMSRHTSQFACALMSVAPSDEGRNSDRQQHLASVGVGHQRAFGHTLRCRPDDRPGRGVRRQVQIQLRRDAGIAGVLPIGVPALAPAAAAGRRGTA